MKSNNVDSGSRGSTQDVALQCQHTSINNLIKRPVVKTLFRLPFFFQTCRKKLAAKSSRMSRTMWSLCPTGGRCEFTVGVSCHAVFCSTSHLLLVFLSCCPLPPAASDLMSPSFCHSAFFLLFPSIEVDTNPHTHTHTHTHTHERRTPGL